MPRQRARAHHDLVVAAGGLDAEKNKFFFPLGVFPEKVYFCDFDFFVFPQEGFRGDSPFSHGTCHGNGDTVFALFAERKLSVPACLVIEHDFVEAFFRQGPS